MVLYTPYGAAASRVQEAAENIKPAFSEKNDELREKIEADPQNPVLITTIRGLGYRMEPLRES